MKMKNERNFARAGPANEPNAYFTNNTAPMVLSKCLAFSFSADRLSYDALAMHDFFWYLIFGHHKQFVYGELLQYSVASSPAYPELM